MRHLEGVDSSDNVKHTAGKTERKKRTRSRETTLSAPDMLGTARNTQRRCSPFSSVTPVVHLAAKGGRVLRGRTIQARTNDVGSAVQMIRMHLSKAEMHIIQSESRAAREKKTTHNLTPGRVVDQECPSGA